jgi:hypothetical protein
MYLKDYIPELEECRKFTTHLAWPIIGTCVIIKYVWRAQNFGKILKKTFQKVAKEVDQ